MGQDAALEERLDLVDHETRQARFAPGLCFGLGQKGAPVLGEQPVEYRLLRPMAGVCAFGRRGSRAWGEREDAGFGHRELSGVSTLWFLMRGAIGNCPAGYDCRAPFVLENGR